MARAIFRHSLNKLEYNAGENNSFIQNLRHHTSFRRDVKSRFSAQIRQPPAQFEAQILVEQQLHAAVNTRRSRSAA
jgi:hypothetical protein